MLEQDAADLLDGLGMSLHGVARPHDHLGDRLVDVGALVGHDAVVSVLHRSVPSTAMIECAAIVGGTGMEASVSR